MPPKKQNKISQPVLSERDIQAISSHAATAMMESVRATEAKKAIIKDANLWEAIWKIISSTDKGKKTEIAHRFNLKTPRPGSSETFISRAFIGQNDSAQVFLFDCEPVWCAIEVIHIQLLSFDPASQLLSFAPASIERSVRQCGIDVTKRLTKSVLPSGFEFVMPLAVLRQSSEPFTNSTQNLDAKTSTTITALESKEHISLETEEYTTWLHFVISANRADALSIFLDLNADPNATDAYHNTPLHLAVCNNDIESIQILMQYGADPNQNNAQGFSPFDQAVLSGNYAVIEAFLNKRHTTPLVPLVKRPFKAVDLAAETGKKFSTWYYVLSIKKPEILRLVLDSASTHDIDVSDSKGNSPLIIAILADYTVGVGLLLKAHASTHTLTKTGRSPLMLAQALERNEICKMLEAYINQNNAFFDNLIGQLLKSEFDDIINSSRHTVPSKKSTALKPSAPPITIEKAQSARMYLRNNGFTAEEITHFQRTNGLIDLLPSATQHNQEQKAVSIVSWLNGQITSDMPHISQLEEAFPAYFYADAAGLEAQGCSDPDLFEARCFCTPVNRKGLKYLSDACEGEVKLGSEIRTVSFEFENKVYSGAQRVLCFGILSDDGRTMLYIAALYLPNGLHKTADVEALKQRLRTCLPVNLPPSRPALSGLLAECGFLSTDTAILKKQSQFAPGKKAKNTNPTPSDIILDYCGYSR